MKTDWREEFPGSEIPTNPVTFLSFVLDYENAAAEKCYREWAIIALNSYCIALSTALVERVFSHITNVKTKARNKLSMSSLEAILRIRSHMFVYQICCQNFAVTDKMPKIFTIEIKPHTHNHLLSLLQLLVVLLPMPQRKIKPAPSKKFSPLNFNSTH